MPRTTAPPKRAIVFLLDIAQFDPILNLVDDSSSPTSNLSYPPKLISAVQRLISVHNECQSCDLLWAYRCFDSSNCSVSLTRQVPLISYSPASFLKFKDCVSASFSKLAGAKRSSKEKYAAVARAIEDVLSDVDWSQGSDASSVDSFLDDPMYHQSSTPQRCHASHSLSSCLYLFTSAPHVADDLLSFDHSSAFPGQFPGENPVRRMPMPMFPSRHRDTQKTTNMRGALGSLVKRRIRFNWIDSAGPCGNGQKSLVVVNAFSKWLSSISSTFKHFNVLSLLLDSRIVPLSSLVQEPEENICVGADSQSRQFTKTKNESSSEWARVDVGNMKGLQGNSTEKSSHSFLPYFSAQLSTSSPELLGASSWCEQLVSQSSSSLGCSRMVLRGFLPRVSDEQLDKLNSFEQGALLLTPRKQGAKVNTSDTALWTSLFAGLMTNLSHRQCGLIADILRAKGDRYVHSQTVLIRPLTASNASVRAIKVHKKLSRSGATPFNMSRVEGDILLRKHSELKPLDFPSSDRLFQRYLPGVVNVSERERGVAKDLKGTSAIAALRRFADASSKELPMLFNNRLANAMHSKSGSALKHLCDALRRDEPFSGGSSGGEEIFADSGVLALVQPSSGNIVSPGGGQERNQTGRELSIPQSPVPRVHEKVTPPPDEISEGSPNHVATDLTNDLLLVDQIHSSKRSSLIFQATKKCNSSRATPFEPERRSDVEVAVSHGKSLQARFRCALEGVDRDVHGVQSNSSEGLCLPDDQEMISNKRLTTDPWAPILVECLPSPENITLEPYNATRLADAERDVVRKVKKQSTEQRYALPCRDQNSKTAGRQVLSAQMPQLSNQDVTNLETNASSVPAAECRPYLKRTHQATSNASGVQLPIKDFHEHAQPGCILSKVVSNHAYDVQLPAKAVSKPFLQSNHTMFNPQCLSPIKRRTDVVNISVPTSAEHLTISILNSNTTAPHDPKSDMPMHDSQPSNSVEMNFREEKNRSFEHGMLNDDDDLDNSTLEIQNNIPLHTSTDRCDEEVQGTAEIERLCSKFGHCLEEILSSQENDIGNWIRESLKCISLLVEKVANAKMWRSMKGCIPTYLQKHTDVMAAVREAGSNLKDYCPLQPNLPILRLSVSILKALEQTVWQIAECPKYHPLSSEKRQKNLKRQRKRVTAILSAVQFAVANPPPSDVLDLIRECLGEFLRDDLVKLLTGSHPESFRSVLKSIYIDYDVDYSTACFGRAHESREAVVIDEHPPRYSTPESHSGIEGQMSSSFSDHESLHSQRKRPHDSVQIVDSAIPVPPVKKRCQQKRDLKEMIAASRNKKSATDRNRGNLSRQRKGFNIVQARTLQKPLSVKKRKTHVGESEHPKQNRFSFITEENIKRGSRGACRSLTYPSIQTLTENDKIEKKPVEDMNRDVAVFRDDNEVFVPGTPIRPSKAGRRAQYLRLPEVTKIAEADVEHSLMAEEAGPLLELMPKVVPQTP